MSLVALATFISLTLITFFLRKPIVTLLTNDPEVIQFCCSVLVVVHLFFVFDMYKNYLAGVIRGIGR